MAEQIPVVESVMPAEAIPQVAAAIPPNSESYLGPTASAPFVSTSLYVGELDESVTESMLYDLFSMVGTVSSIRVCRDALSRNSLGYAYVNYHNRHDCDRAIETLNFAEIKGRPCRIMWSQRDPSIRKSGEGNIFIKNLDKSIDHKALHDTFISFGKILSCKVAVDKEGNSLGYGFVHYESKESAESAIANVNGMLLNDTQVFVGPHIPRRDRLSKVEEMKKSFTNIFVKNLDPAVTDKELHDLFSKYGEITSYVVQLSNGVSRGFGFVNFVDHECASKAVEELHDTEFYGKKLFVSRAQKKFEREEELRKQYEQLRLEKLNKYQGVNLYIKNFDEDVDDEKLRNEFAVYGVITSVKVMRDENGKSRGFGFVCFSSPDEATKAVSEMNNRMWGNKPIYVALAQRKDQRRSHLEALSRQIKLAGQMNIGSNVNTGMYPSGPMYYPQGQGYPQQRGMAYNSHANPRSGRWPSNQPIPAQGYPSVPPMAGQYNVGVPYQSATNGRHARGKSHKPGPRSNYQASGLNGRTGTANNRGISRSNPRAQAAPLAKQDLPEDVGSTSATVASSVQEDEPFVITAATLAAADPDKQKMMLGEVLYSLIASTQPELAGKITGMLLEMDNAEILHLIENGPALEEKVNEAVEVLKKSGRDIGAGEPGAENVGFSQEAAA